MIFEKLCALIAEQFNVDADSITLEEAGYRAAFEDTEPQTVQDQPVEDFSVEAPAA